MSNNVVWITVEVHSGIPAAVKVFSSYETAMEYSTTLQESLNLDNDEIGIFEVNLDTAILQFSPPIKPIPSLQLNH